MRYDGRIASALKLIGLLLFAWLLSRIDRGLLAAQLQNVDVALLLVSLLILLLSDALKVLRWHMLLRAAGMATGIGYAWRTYQVGLFLGLITPGKLGEFGRAGYLKRDGLTAGTAVAVALAERAFDVVAIGLLSLLAVGVLFGSYWLGFGCGLALATVPFALWAVLRARRTRTDRPWLAFVTSLLIRPLLLAGLLSLTFASWSLYCAWAVALSQAVALGAPGPVVVSSVILAGVVALLPIAPSGLGTRDATLAALLAPFGVDPARAVALSFLMFLSIVATSLLGAFEWLRGVSPPRPKR